RRVRAQNLRVLRDGDVVVAQVVGDSRLLQRAGAAAAEDERHQARAEHCCGDWEPLMWCHRTMLVPLGNLNSNRLSLRPTFSLRFWNWNVLFAPWSSVLTRPRSFSVERSTTR